MSDKNGPLIGVPNRTPRGQVWEIKPGFMLVTTIG